MKMKKYFLTRNTEEPRLVIGYAVVTKLVEDYLDTDKAASGGYLPKLHIKRTGYWATNSQGRKIKVHFYKV